MDIALITADNKIAFRDQIPLTEEEDKVDKITSTFFNIMKPKVGDRRIMGLCIIIPGIIDAENKRILSTVIGVGYSDPVVQRFEEAFHDYPFCLLNDTACFAYAEYVFANITEPNFAYINVSKGVGACLFANALALVGLKDTGKKKAKDFSLGMRQRLALAIALLGNPEFLVLDEPINGLDPTGIIELRNLLKRLNKERGITILISSHILTELHQLANRYGILHEGKLLQEITATELDKRCKKHLLLQVNDVAAASVLLESKLNTSNFSVMPDKSIHLYDYVENAGKVSALLSANNITIYQLAQSGDSLETYYTNLIGGCQND